MMVTRLKPPLPRYDAVYGCGLAASNRNVAVSDQFKAETRRMRLSRDKLELWSSILVNGQGPAMQDARPL